MPKAKPAYGKNTASSFNRPPADLILSRSELKQVRKVCADDAFVKAIKEMARVFRSFRYIGTVGASEAAVTLDDLAFRIDDIHHKLHDLPVSVGRLIIERKHQVINNALLALVFLHQEVLRAREQVQPGPGREGNHVGVEVAKALRKLFTRHGLPFAEGDSPIKGVYAPSCICLRIVLGLSETARVEHLIDASREKGSASPQYTGPS